MERAVGERPSERRKRQLHVAAVAAIAVVVVLVVVAAVVVAVVLLRESFFQRSTCRWLPQLPSAWPHRTRALTGT